MKRLVIGVLVGLAAAPLPAGGDVPTKQPLVRHANTRVVIQPGETVRWQSPRIGSVTRLSLVIQGREAFYQAEPRTHSCVAYGYEAGVAIRLTDCAQGKRVPYVRIRAVSAALKPVKVVLRLTGGS